MIFKFLKDAEFTRYPRFSKENLFHLEKHHRYRDINCIFARASRNHYRYSTVNREHPTMISFFKSIRSCNTDKGEHVANVDKSRLIMRDSIQKTRRQEGRKSRLSYKNAGSGRAPNRKVSA